MSVNEEKICFLANKHFKRNPSREWFIEQVGEEAVELHHLFWNRYPEALVRELRLRWVLIRVTETNWSIKRIAREVNVSEEMLRQEFQARFEKSPEMYREFWQSLVD